MHNADFYLNSVLMNTEIYSELLKYAKQFLEYTKGLLAVAESAVLRLSIADCKEAE